jgi:ABC-type amino acid transport system permease subunit
MGAQNMIRDFSFLDVLILLRATQWTIALSLIAFIGGIALGLVIAIMRTAKYKIPRIISRHAIAHATLCFIFWHEYYRN